MKWEPIVPQSGDIVRVKAGSIWHYGIYVTDNEIIQFGQSPAIQPMPPANQIAVLSTDIDTFLQGEFLEVGVCDKKEARKKRKAEHIVQIARERLGEQGYNILHNNCEHFVNECVFGVHTSAQIESFREKFRNSPVVDVYYAAIPKNKDVQAVYPPARNTEIQNCKNETVKQEKYYVWKLLEYALLHTFGLHMQKLKFRKKANGQWICNGCNFSLSHSRGVVAVAVSKAPVGVDVEHVKPPKSQNICQRIFTEKERQAFNALPLFAQTDFFIQKWTEKESVFKKSQNKTFVPNQIEAEDVQSVRIEAHGEAYFISAASQDISYMRVKPAQL